jgi:hypothetical protein
MSPYDETWHVFWQVQVADPTRMFAEALCQHSAPLAKLGHTPAERMCPPCVRALGELMPELALWRMGD